jgi:glycosyltransferase involved in cell wall biosynthesis
MPLSNDAVSLLPGPTVSVLMCTYQGAPFLSKQLESIAEQTHTRWRVRVSDDGSTDDTFAILERYRRAWGADRLTVMRGPSAGFAANFQSLTCCPDTHAEFFAWADQDDVWAPDKLQRALAWLQSAPPGVPAIFGTRTLLTDADDRLTGMSPLFTRPPSFANALVQCIAGCNTMVFNRAARELFIEASSQGDALPPDWLMYLLVAGCGGRVHYDPWSSVRYRQHGQNLSGSNLRLRGRWKRARLLMTGEFRGWVDANLERLARVRHRMPAHHLAVLDEFAQARQRHLPGRLIGFWRSGIHRQTALGNLGLSVAALFNKL